MCVCVYNVYVSGYVCVCVCVCGESVCLALESAGVCHFQMNHRQTGSTCI